MFISGYALSIEKTQGNLCDVDIQIFRVSFRELHLEGEPHVHSLHWEFDWWNYIGWVETVVAG